MTNARQRALNLHLKTLCEVQGRMCAYCFEHMSRKRRLGDGPRCHEKPLNPRRATIEHVLPRRLGGRDFGNVVAAHSCCNDKKGGRAPTGCELIALAWVNAKVQTRQVGLLARLTMRQELVDKGVLVLRNNPPFSPEARG